MARVHYSADPAKTSPEWIAAARAGMPERGWQREYEVSFDTPEGEAVFPEFRPQTMVREFGVLPDARLLRGWDFGHVCPAVIFAQLDAYGRFRVLSELILEGSSLDQLVHAAQMRTVELVGRQVECFDAGDPAGEAFTDLGQVKQILANYGIFLSTLRMRTESYHALRKRLLTDVMVPKEGPSPSFLVRPSCPILIEALSGAFVLGTKEPFKPQQTHPYKDVVDATRYLHDNLLGLQADHLTAMREAARADWVW